MGTIAWLDPEDPGFPSPETALRDPNGLLAVGGDLSVERLLNAYRSGVFPWYEAGQPLLWWSPSPRCVLFPDRFRASRSLARRLRRNEFEVRLDTAFGDVVDGCSAPRDEDGGTWITPEMRAAYVELHRLGYAHSIETWQDGDLVGGLYGVSLGKLFFGESMFHRTTDASKVSFAWLCRLMNEHGGPLIDCQIENEHLNRLGAELMDRDEFLGYLDRFAAKSVPAIPWQQMQGSLGPW